MFGQHDDSAQQATSDSGVVTPAEPTATPIAIPDDLSAGLDLSAPPLTDLPPTQGTDAAASTAPSTTPATVGSDDLLTIKQEALQQLSPLVGHLEQTPEEKFRTTMMMIQAADDQSLIKAAYEAAKQITDEKTRAQALLDIVNEINYFTQQHNS